MSIGSQSALAAFKMPRYAPAWFSAFLFGLLVLFIEQLPETMRTFMVPSVLVYSMGCAILGTLHRMVGVHYWPGYPNWSARYVSPGVRISVQYRSINEGSSSHGRSEGVARTEAVA